jgi:SAM-dependent methyltransferase
MAELEKVGWFTTKGRPGDRLLKQQVVGLDYLFERLGKRDPPLTVLDVGCAEGLITMKCFDAGAIACHGVEIVPGHVDVANDLRGGRACTFEVGDANDWQPKRQYDVVLLLAILHKLKDPLEACKRFADAARSLVVIRLPPGGPVIRDERTNFHPFDVGAVMAVAGFELAKSGPDGPFGEWVGNYVRCTW